MNLVYFLEILNQYLLMKCLGPNLILNELNWFTEEKEGQPIRASQSNQFFVQGEDINHRLFTDTREEDHDREIDRKEQETSLDAMITNHYFLLFVS